MSDEASYDLLNIFEIETPEGPQYLVCFLEPMLAGSRGIEGKAVIGEFTPGPDGDFDPYTFRLNREFTNSISGFMNEHALESDSLQQQAQASPGAELYLVDPRFDGSDGEPSPGDLLGSIQVDEDGQPVPGSFVYNSKHVMFDPHRGPSGLLMDRDFYDWLHPIDR